MWQRLSAVRTFIEHVYPSDVDANPEDVQTILRLWKVIVIAVNIVYIKGLCHGDLAFWVKNMLKFKLNTFFSRYWNAPRTSRERNRMIFLKEEQISFWRLVQETREGLKTSV